MLPLRPGGSAQQIGGARLDGQGVALPGRAGLAPEAEEAGREQRDADHVAEDAFVAVPADRGAGTVLGDQRVRQLFCGEAREGGGAFAQLKQERRHRFRLPQFPRAEVVMPAIRDDTAVADVAVELELLQRKLLYLPDKSLLLVRGQDVGLVAESRRGR